MKPGYVKPHPAIQFMLQSAAVENPYVPFVAMGRADYTKVRADTHWLTALGQWLRPDQMTNEHKVNCIRMLANGRALRTAMLHSAISAFAYAKNAPDGAADAAMEAGTEMIDGAYGDYEARVRFLVEQKPLVAEMVRLLEANGVNPYFDWKRELYDGELTREKHQQLKRQMLGAMYGTGPALFIERLGSVAELEQRVAAADPEDGLVEEVRRTT
jgi:hypothetical protein